MCYQKTVTACFTCKNVSQTPYSVKYRDNDVSVKIRNKQSNCTVYLYNYTITSINNLHIKKHLISTRKHQYFHGDNIVDEKDLNKYGSFSLKYNPIHFRNFVLFHKQIYVTYLRIMPTEQCLPET